MNTVLQDILKQGRVNMIRVSYKKHFLTGVQQGKFVEEYQDVPTWVHAINLSRLLNDVSEEASVVDPYTGFKCYVSDVQSSLLN